MRLASAVFPTATTHVQCDSHPPTVPHPPAGQIHAHLGQLRPRHGGLFVSRDARVRRAFHKTTPCGPRRGPAARDHGASRGLDGFRVLQTTHRGQYTDPNSLLYAAATVPTFTTNQPPPPPGSTSITPRPTYNKPSIRGTGTENSVPKPTSWRRYKGRPPVQRRTVK